MPHPGNLPEEAAVRAVLAGLALLLVASCAQGDDAPVDTSAVQREDFAGGTCLVLADELVLVRAFTGQTLVDDPERAALDASSAALLQEEARRFRQGLRLAGEELTGPLTAFVEALDAVSARLAAGTYDDPSLLQRVVDTADDLIRACT